MNMPTTISVPAKKAVRRAGEVLRNTGGHSADEVRRAVDVLSQWRSLHFYPINTIQATLRQRVRKDFPGAIVAQRLKRFPSIVGKLLRFPDMQLDRMQDIGGLRVICDRIGDVYALHEGLPKSRRFKHTAINPCKDYIREPKPDGYRSLHQVFQYQNKQHEALNVLKIEVQLRSKLQHAWATAVETLGIVERASFKTGEGSEQFKHFFRLSSELFAYSERRNGHTVAGVRAVAAELDALEQSLQITSKLHGFAVSARHISGTKANGYHLMELDVGVGRISLVPFADDQLDLAESLYREREQKTSGNANISVVLISAGNIREIKKAYPNYFLDTTLFVRALGRLCARYR